MCFKRHFQSLCIIAGLLVMLSACGQAEKVNSAATTVTAPSPTAPTEASQRCLAAGKARVAVMSALPAGKQANLVYASQSTATDVSYDATTLLRYDATTGKTTTLVKGNIAHWSISPDGQWMGLTIALQNQWAVQLIRMDGQQLQTLYCSPDLGDLRFSPYLSDLLFSPDQHSLVFVQTSTDNNFHPLVSTLNRLDLTTGRLQTFYSDPGSLSDLLFSPQQHFLAFTEEDNAKSSSGLQVDILDFTTGKVQAVMSDRRPGFPGHDQGQASVAQSSTPSFSSLRPVQQHLPEPGAEWNQLLPLKWVNNKSLFIFLGDMGSPGSIIHLDLLQDVGKDAALQGSNLQLVTTNDECPRFGVTPDNQQLVCSVYDPYAGYPGEQPIPAAIKIRPVTGGTMHTIYSGAKGGFVEACAVSNSTLLFTENNALWKVNIDGGGLTRLMSDPGRNMDINLTRFSLWSSCYYSDSLYALSVSGTGGSTEESLMVGSIAGGKPTPIVKTASDILELIGWVQL